MLSTFTPFIPTNKQIREWGYSDEMRHKLEQLAISILQRLFVPLMKRWRGKRARRKLLKSLIRNHFPGKSANEFSEQVILYKSDITQVTPFLHTPAVAESVGKGSPKVHISEVSNVRDDPDGVPQDQEADLNKVSVENTPSSIMLPPIISSPPLASLTRFNFSGTEPIAKKESLSSSFSQAQAKAAKTVREVVSNAVECDFTFRAYLKGEVVQWPMEPAHEVLILLKGSLERVMPHKVGSNDSHSGFWSKSLSKPSLFSPSTTSLQSVPSISGIDASGRHATLQPELSTKGLMDSSHSLHGSIDKQATSQRWRSKLFPVDYVIHRDLLSAPSVLGESACIGGFPFCAEVVVQSEWALIASLPFDAYCRIITVLPLNSQRRLLTHALKQRELLMPYFAPMTRERLCVCPFLSRLKPEDVNHLREYLVPKVYAAGMLCNESTDLKHIFFIRRGIVCVEHENRNIVEAFSSSCPKSRTLLTEGHTFGEVQCISRESLGDLFYAVNHIDMYVLRFDMLIRLMKQWPAAHKAVIIAASVLSKLDAKEVPSLSFSLSGVDIAFMRSAAKRQNIMSELENLHFSPINKGSGNNLSSRRRSSNADNLDSSAFFSVERTLSPTKCRAANARTEATSPPNFSLLVRSDPSGFVKVMKRIPLLGLVVKEEDLGDLSVYWRCHIFDKGDFVVRRGEECNRLLYFCDGRAGIILDENQFQKEVRAQNPFADACSGEVDLSCLSTKEVFPIPLGHTIGYTCVRRHRWTHSVVAMEDNLEVWVLERAALVSFLWKCKLDHQMQSATLQLLQPLVLQHDRIPLLDYQPLLSPFPNSLWSEHPMPNMHPVSMIESKVIYSVWQEGDFPLLM
ncbi:unnamed protein product [Phytomonas sp. EM1]|nr:unnamed protein product [Phytomonas sp. EM1]|eukprot:CCW60393.1 unnamed protein product [Phytomonas sp. isolate EM1]